MEAEATVYHVQVRGFWNTTHEFSQDTDTGRKVLGTLSIKRGLWMVTEGVYKPLEGEVLTFRRDPGLLRSQFSVWTDGREWLGSSLRWTTARRRIDLSTGSKPYTMLPIEGWRMGWSLYAPKSGEMARLVAEGLGRQARIESYRRIEFPMLVLMYFLGSQIYLESLIPGPQPEKVKAQASATAV
jgi:hypothetical protein